MGGANDRPHPRGEDWNRPLTDKELERLYRMASSTSSGSGGSTRNPGAYQLSMMAGLLIFTVLGSRILAELARIRRKLS
ncbi:MAG: hypothetical protein ACREF4_10520 [Gammaproteobacteria bacterium]